MVEDRDIVDEARASMKVTFREFVALAERWGQEKCQALTDSPKYSASYMGDAFMVGSPDLFENEVEAYAMACLVIWAWEAVASGQPDLYDVDLEQTSSGWLPVIRRPDDY